MLLHKYLKPYQKLMTGVALQVNSVTTNGSIKLSNLCLFLVDRKWHLLTPSDYDLAIINRML